MLIKHLPSAEEKQMEISINVSEKQLNFINKEEILCLKQVSEVACGKTLNWDQSTWILALAPCYCYVFKHYTEDWMPRYYYFLSPLQALMCCEFYRVCFPGSFKMEVAHDALNVISCGGWSREGLLK